MGANNRYTALDRGVVRILKRHGLGYRFTVPELIDEYRLMIGPIEGDAPNRFYTVLSKLRMEGCIKSYLAHVKNSPQTHEYVSTGYVKIKGARLVALTDKAHWPSDGRAIAGFGIASSASYMED